MSRILFYGLFMDRSLLAEKGLHPEVIGPAVLRDYRIHIGARATLLRSASSRAYGVVMELDDEEARVLYSEPSVHEYARERVQVELLETGETVEAECYNLPVELGLTGANHHPDRNVTAQILLVLGEDGSMLGPVQIELCSASRNDGSRSVGYASSAKMLPRATSKSTPLSTGNCA